MSSTPEDTKTSAALATALGHNPPFTREELATLTELHVQGAQDLSSLAACPGLRRLSVTGCGSEDLSFLAGMRQMTHLSITAVPVRDVASVVGLDAIEEIELLFSFVEDVSPLLGLPRLSKVHVVGNPLHEASFRETLPALQQRVADFQGPAASYWTVCRELFEAGSGVLIDQFGGPPVLVRPGVPMRAGADCDFIDKVDRDWVRLMVKRLDDPTDLFDFVLSKRPADQPIPSSLRVRPLIEFGSATRALGWLEGAALPEEQAAPLRSLIRRFPRMTFQRRTSEALAAVERSRKVVLPTWLKNLHVNFGGFRSQDVRLVRFASFDHESPLTPSPRESWYTLGLIGANNESERAIIDQDRLFAVASRYPTGNSTLAIKLDDPDDQRVYEFDEERVDRGTGLTGGVRVVFDSYSRMLGAIDGVRLDGDVVVDAIDEP